MEDGDDTFICCKHVLEQHLRRISCLRQGNHSPKEKSWRRSARMNREYCMTRQRKGPCRGSAGSCEVVSQQSLAGSFQLAVSHFVVAIPELLRAQELALGRGGDLEPLGRIELLQLGKYRIAEGFFGMSKNVEAKHPTTDRETDQQENNDRPKKEVALFTDRGIVGAKGKLSAPRVLVSEDCPLRSRAMKISFRSARCLRARTMCHNHNCAHLRDFLTRKPARQALFIVDYRSIEPFEAFGIDKEPCIVAFDDHVVLLWRANAHRILQSSTSALFDGKPKPRCFRVETFLLHEHKELRGGALAVSSIILFLRTIWREVK